MSQIPIAPQLLFWKIRLKLEEEYKSMIHGASYFTAPQVIYASNTIVCLISYLSFFLCVLVRINTNNVKPRKVLGYGCPESWSSWRFRMANSSADSSCYNLDLVFSKVQRKLYLISRSNIYAIRMCVYTSIVMLCLKINKDAVGQGGYLHENWTSFVRTVPRMVPITSALWAVHHHTKLARSHPLLMGWY